MISIHSNFETTGLLNKKLVSNPLLEPPHDKTNKMTVRPAKTQISLGIRPAGRNAIMLVLSRGGSLVFQTVAMVFVKTVAMVLGKTVNELANKRKRKKKNLQ